MGLAAKVAGLPLRTLQRWTDRGVLTPSMAQGQGKGSVDVFSFADLVLLRTLGHLREQGGFSLHQIKKALAALGQLHASQDLNQLHLVGSGADIYLWQGEQVTSLLQQPGQMAFLWSIHLGRIQKEVKAALQEVA